MNAHSLRSLKTTTSIPNKDRNEHIYVSFPNIEVFAGEDDQSTGEESLRTEYIFTNARARGSDLLLRPYPDSDSASCSVRCSTTTTDTQFPHAPSETEQGPTDAELRIR